MSDVPESVILELCEHPTRSAFYRDAIMAFTDEILTNESGEHTKADAPPVIHGAFKKSDSGRRKKA